MILCSLSLLLFLTLGLGCAEQLNPSLLCFAVAGAFSLQQGLQQSDSKSQSSWSLHRMLNSAQPSTLASLLEATPSALPMLKCFFESFKCVSLFVWGLGSRSRTLHPAQSPCNPCTYQQEPLQDSHGQQIHHLLSSSVFFKLGSKRPCRSVQIHASTAQMAKKIYFHLSLYFQYGV